MYDYVCLFSLMFVIAIHCLIFHIFPEVSKTWWWCAMGPCTSSKYVNLQLSRASLHFEVQTIFWIHWLVRVVKPKPTRNCILSKTVMCSNNVQELIPWHEATILMQEIRKCIMGCAPIQDLLSAETSWESHRSSMHRRHHSRWIWMYLVIAFHPSKLYIDIWYPCMFLRKKIHDHDHTWL